MNQLVQSKSFTTFIVLAITLICLGLLPQAQAQTNSAYGDGALVSLTSGVWNSGFGFEALNHDTAGKNNTATGLRSLFSDTSGSNNSATGVYALYGNTTGFFDTAAGAFALANNVSGNYNTANGYGALYRNAADNNTATGFGALFNNTSGSENTALGIGAGQSITGDNNICIGAFVDGVAGESNTLRIGNNSIIATYITGIYALLAAGVPVYVDSRGKLCTNPSSKRFKENIKPMDKSSEALLGAQADHVPLQEGDRSGGHTAVRSRGRGRGKGESRVGGARQERSSLQCALRCGQRDVA
jgi:hypothetical protein